MYIVEPFVCLTVTKGMQVELHVMEEEGKCGCYMAEKNKKGKAFQR